MQKRFFEKPAPFYDKSTHPSGNGREPLQRLTKEANGIESPEINYSNDFFYNCVKIMQ
jgi:hypothetical protein